MREHELYERLDQLLNSRGWTEYKLAKITGLSQSTVGNIFSRRSLPSIDTLEKICSVFDITLSQFFTSDQETMVELTQEQKQFFHHWLSLTSKEKQVLQDLIMIMTQEE